MAADRPRTTDSPTLRAAAAAIAALVCLLLVAAWLLGGFEVPLLAREPPAREVPARDPPATRPAAERDALEDRAPVAQPPGVDPGPPPDLELPNEFTLHLRVVDPLGLPVEGARLFAAPPLCGFGLCPEATDSAGRLTFRCRGRAAWLELWVAVLAWGTVEPLQLLTLEADTPLELEVAARGRQQDRTRLLELVQRDGAERAVARLAENWLASRRGHAPTAATAPRPRTVDADQPAEPPEPPRTGRLRRRDQYDTLCGRSLLLFAEIACGQCHDADVAASYRPLQWAPDLTGSLHPSSRFRDLRHEPPDSEDREQRELALQERAERSATRLAQEVGRDRAGVVTGTVRAQGGRPVQHAQVVWLGGDGAVRQRSVTDEEGVYQLPVPADGPCTLIAAGGSYGRDEFTAVVPPGERLEHDFRLRPQQAVQGRALDTDGAPLAGWRVEFAGFRTAGAALAQTARDGTFTLSDVPRWGTCLLWPPDQDLRLPVLASPVVQADTEAVSLRLTESLPARARLRLHPQLPPGHESARVEVRLLQVDTGRAALLSGTDFAGWFLEGLPPGPYRGEVGAPGLGWTAFGPVHLDGRGLWDLGRIELPVPGRVRLVTLGETRSPLRGQHAFVSVRADTDVLVEATPAGDDTVSLPAGDYALLWVDGDRQLVRGVAVRSGQESTLFVDAR